MGFGIGLGAFVSGLGKGYGLRQQIDDGNRKRKQQDALDKINTDAQTEYDKEVAAGTAQPNQFQQFWEQYALPKRVNQMLMNGDTAGAKSLQDWADSEEAKSGAKLFG